MPEWHVRSSLVNRTFLAGMRNGEYVPIPDIAAVKRCFVIWRIQGSSRYVAGPGRGMIRRAHTHWEERMAPINRPNAAVVLGLLAFSAVTVVPVYACTRALYVGEDGLVITGRSMDWGEDMYSNL